jgi:CTP synthase (UTP-ammonia lyase)
MGGAAESERLEGNGSSMTQDELENSESEVEITTSETSTTVGAVSTEATFIDIYGSIDKSFWDAALADPSDASVLIHWLESKRADAEDE